MLHLVLTGNMNHAFYKILWILGVAGASAVAATDNDHDDLVKEAHEKVRIEMLSLTDVSHFTVLLITEVFLFSFQVIRAGLSNIPATRKWTPESRLMEERNAAVSAAARAMLDRRVAADEREAHSRASEAFARRYTGLC